MIDGFKVRVFVPLASQGDASAGIQAAVRIASELGYGVHVIPIDMCQDADEGSGSLSGVKIAKGTYAVGNG